MTLVIQSLHFSHIQDLDIVHVFELFISYIMYIVDPFFAIDYPFLMHCGIEKGPNCKAFQSHNASEKDNQWQKMDQHYSL